MCGGMSQRYSELSALTHERLKILFAVFMVAVLIVVGHVVRAPPPPGLLRACACGAVRVLHAASTHGLAWDNGHAPRAARP